MKSTEKILLHLKVSTADRSNNKFACISPTSGEEFSMRCVNIIIGNMDASHFALQGQGKQ
jgi:hypothetical protein